MTLCLFPLMNLPKYGLLLEERICSYRSKFFLVRADFFRKGSKMKMTELHPLIVYPFTLNKRKLGFSGHASLTLYAEVLAHLFKTNNVDS